MKTLLLSGVHGVGKGYLLEQISINTKAYTILSASNLIERYKDATDAGYKKVSSVKDNQEILLKALNEEQEKAEGTLIIDGHLCIINANDEVERIPDCFFERGQIDGIILLQDEASNISNRLKNRDNQLMTISFINEMQQKEINFATYLKNTYGIEYEIIKPQCNQAYFEEIIQRIGGHKYGK